MLVREYICACQRTNSTYWYRRKEKSHRSTPKGASNTSGNSKWSVVVELVHLSDIRRHFAEVMTNCWKWQRTRGTWDWSGRGRPCWPSSVCPLCRPLRTPYLDARVLPHVLVVHHHVQTRYVQDRYTCCQEYIHHADHYASAYVLNAQKEWEFLQILLLHFDIFCGQ